MTEAELIIKAVTDMHASINASFEKVYTEINGCNNRVTEIETVMAVKKALCKEKEKNKKAKKDYWIPIVRSVNIAGILALLVLAWEKLTAIWKMVP